MATSSSVQAWTLRMPAGSLQQWQFAFTTTSAAGVFGPYPISGATWEYVVRPTPTDLTSPPLVKVTTASSTAGIIAITSTAALSQALLSLYPAATAALAPGQYYHALWMQPATAGAVAWVTGTLLIAGNPQP